MTIHTSHCHCHVIAHHLATQHSQSLTLSWVHLSGHYTWPRLVLGQIQLTNTASWTWTQQSYIIGYFGQTCSQCVERTVKLNQRIMGGKRLKFIRSSYKVKTSLFANLFSNHNIKTLKCVETSTYSSSSLGYFKYIRNSRLYSFYVLANHLPESWKLLS